MGHEKTGFHLDEKISESFEKYNMKYSWREESELFSKKKLIQMKELWHTR